ncbi:MAG TPA: hypothetical protein VHF88_01795 [Thermoleophilaceae bacterium]|nr:hypothetical protein [Thermoleophilaceae bacterium]
MQLAHTLVRGATAPIKLGLSAGELGLSVVRAVVDEARRAVSGGDASTANGWSGPSEPAVGTPASSTRPHGDPLAPRDRGPSTARTTTATPEAKVASPPAPAPEAVTPPPPVEPVAASGPAVPAVPPTAGAKQVDDDPVPVAEFAEPGAADGAGAEVSIDPPWDGYDGLTAAQIKQRLKDADSEVVATVALYEGLGRKRRSVLDAADRRLRALSS